jgi:drug/metabolite transporter (DMT)-like permease
MWILLALGAAVLWGVSYAARGRVIQAGLSPTVFFFYYAVLAALMAAAVLMVRGEMASVPRAIDHLGKDRIWLLVSVVSAAVGGLLIFVAIGQKNATLPALVEISYPFFVALFARVFFRETQLDPASLLGGLLIASGVFTLFVANRD